LRILIAEDNKTNQKVALLMLKRLGYRADVAENGLEVLEAMRGQSYDIVLMDLQMPEMDGLEATREIRRLWPAHGPRIVAVTTTAISGGRELCLAAGMDGYINKPVRMEALQGALERCRDQALEPADQSAESQSDLLDLSILATLRELSDDEEPNFFTTIIETFFNDVAFRLTDLAEALALRDMEALQRAAHTLKGSSANIGAKHIAAICLELEKCAESDAMEESAALLKKLSLVSNHTQRAFEAEMRTGNAARD
jgi:CheY-like chemotaxis protein